MKTSLISDELIQLCAPGGQTLSDALAKDPTASIQSIAEKLYKAKTTTKLLDKLSIGTKKGIVLADETPTEEDFQRAIKCGNFKERPSDLFLSMYISVLRTLEKDPLGGLVSPPLIGSTGVIPLSIISVIPDIIGHYADVIVRATESIFFMTNFWEASNSATTICDAFRELSRRVGERGGPKVVVKLMYDRGTPKQVLDNHQLVDEKTYTGDRVKLPTPNEIPNLSLEVLNYHAPPVGTFHAKYLVVDRKIVCLNSNNIQDRVNVEMMTHIEGDIVNSFYEVALLSWWKALSPPPSCVTHPPSPQTSFSFGNDHVDIKKKDIEGSKESSRALLAEHHEYAAGEIKQDTGSLEKKEESEKPTDEPKESSKWDINNAAEVDRVQAKLSSENAVTDHLNTGTKITGTEPSSAIATTFHPHILHKRHDPVPMAVVARSAVGKPGHHGTVYPQNAAFLAGFKFAKKKVFIQTPTFNAALVEAAALEAVRRGIEVIIYADLGFNDEGELLPFQNGTNEMVATRMYKALEKDSEKKLLRWFWYTGKDQNIPLNAADKSRNCHVKFMSVDDTVAIQGNGNQDTQSWYHSCEVNVMVDSPQLCEEWAAGIRSNENTHLHGELAKDGVWRDKNGDTLPGAKPPPSGPFKSLAGVKGAIQRVRGEGGF